MLSPGASAFLSVVGRTTLVLHLDGKRPMVAARKLFMSVVFWGKGLCVSAATVGNVVFRWEPKWKGTGDD